MGRSPNTPPGDLELAVVGIIGRELDALGLSHRAFAPSVGVSHSRLSRMLSGKASVTVTQLHLMCQALGFEASRVVRTAEAQVEDIKPIEAQPKPSHLVMPLPRRRLASAPNPPITDRSSD